MSATLRIRSAGPGSTLQDAGRFGLLRFGVTPAGPMDQGAFMAALVASGDPHGAAIEVSLGGMELSAEGGEIGLAIAGGAFDLKLDGQAVPAACALTLAPGSRLTLRAGVYGAWCYVAPFGRFDLPSAFGSLATHTRSGIGGLEGRMLRAGDAVRIVDPRPAPQERIAISAPWLGQAAERLRVILGPQQDYFSPPTIETFLSSPWRLSPRSDRMAYRLEGPPVQHLKGHDIVSDGLDFGAIQIPGDGAPLVLMADRQPTGGYPKIAHVITADLAALAQKRPGDFLSFEAVTWEQAIVARRARARLIEAGVTLTPLGGAELTAEFLLAQNLIGGVIGATDER